MPRTPQVPPLAGMTPLGFTERTPAGPQHVLPGAGHDQASALRRRATAPLKPNAPQAACDFGLFGDTHRQSDLVDLARKDLARKDLARK